MTSLTKTLGALLTTLLVGSVTFLFAAPKKMHKSKTRVTKTTPHPHTDGNDELFI